MKLLIGYDGSPCGDAVLEDLERAGIPADAEALIVTIAEVWVLHQPETGESERPTGAPDESDASISEHSRTLIRHAESLADAALQRVKRQFPGWSVHRRVYCDSPAWGLLHMADEWEPDLTIVGSHGRGALRRLVLGSVSQKLLTECHGSVRIARDSTVVQGAPLRLLVGVDGTPDSKAAVAEIARRSWPSGTTVLALGAIGEMFIPPGLLGTDFSDWFEEGGARAMLEKETAAAVETLGAAGLNARAHVSPGSPAQTLLEEAKKWGADTIFLGARGHRYFERFLLGSVSSAVAARAHCSVEITRTVRAENSEGRR